MVKRYVTRVSLLGDQGLPVFGIGSPKISVRYVIVLHPPSWNILSVLVDVELNESKTN